LWPGNVRELSNVIERTIVLARGPVLEIPAELVPGAPREAEAPADPPSDASKPPQIPGRTLEEMERRHIEATLEQTRWVIEGERGAAAHPGMSASTLRSRMKKLGVRRPAR